MNHSPRITQLPVRTSYTQLPKEIDTDVCIVGAGIAGIMTAYYTLLYTKHRVMLLDAHKIAHGATGHNAGQIAPYFEKPFDEMVTQYGPEKAHDAQQAVRDARDKLQEIVDCADLKTPVHFFIGYAGCSTVEQLEKHLHRKQFRDMTKNSFDAIFVRDDLTEYASLKQRYPGLFEGMKCADIQTHLQTTSNEFVALLACKKGVTNSALLCEELVQWMKKKYADRLSVYEYAPVRSIELYDTSSTVYVSPSDHHAGAIIRAERVVLCTNGFEYFTIRNMVGEDIDTMFHRNVSGLIGYMSAYLDHAEQSPMAISYFTQRHMLHSATQGSDDVYFYLTRRPYKFGNTEHTLISIGGPELALVDMMVYDRHTHQPDRAHHQNESFLKKYYAFYHKDNEYMFRWHGLMGFTKTGLRMIGPDQNNSVLMYNLGCNGVGILTSIYGGRKVGKLLAGEKFPESVFDGM